MKVLLFVFLILSICASGFAAEARGFFRNPAHPGKCVYEGLVLSAGEEGKLPNTCGRLLCGANSFGVIQTCGTAYPPNGCEFGDYININAPYGECCEREVLC